MEACNCSVCSPAGGSALGMTTRGCGPCWSTAATIQKRSTDGLDKCSTDGLDTCSTDWPGQMQHRYGAAVAHQEEEVEAVDHRGDGQHRLPVLAQDVEADVALQVDVGVVDLRGKGQEQACLYHSLIVWQEGRQLSERRVHKERSETGRTGKMLPCCMAAKRWPAAQPPLHTGSRHPYGPCAHLCEALDLGRIVWVAAGHRKSEQEGAAPAQEMTWTMCCRLRLGAAQLPEAGARPNIQSCSSQEVPCQQHVACPCRQSQQHVAHPCCRSTSAHCPKQLRPSLVQPLVRLQRDLKVHDLVLWHAGWKVARLRSRAADGGLPQRQRQAWQCRGRAR